MKTKTIFKTLALAMLMPAMLLTTACSNSDDEIVNTENPTNTKGYALPVTVNVTRQGDATTRATYNDNGDGTGSLAFSAGDKLFVSGFYDDDNLYDFAGVLTWQPGDTFSGTIYLEGPFEGTAEELLSSALGANATLLPAGYGGYGFLGIDNEGTCDASLNLDKTKTFALTKATAVEQFSEEFTEEYNNGFALSPERAIVCFTISGLEANKEVAVSFKCNHPWGAEYSWSIDDNVTVGATGVATFAVGMAKYENFTNYSLTVDGNAITLPADKEVEAGKIYNITRNAIPEVAVSDLSMLDCAGLARASRWTANCYMVHTAGDYKLPLVYGNAIKNGATNTAAYTGVSGQLETFPRHDGSAITGPWIKDNGITVATAELLWQDATGLVTAVGIDGDYLTLTVGKDAGTQEGNAVVAAKDGDGTIVWSWHIWVTKQTFAAADLATVATGSHDYKVTPVNLGWVGNAVSQGYNTFYQWGRKDPFPHTGSVTYSTSSATIADNIKNPTTFYNVSNYPNTSTANNLWDAQQTSTDGNIATATVKTVYDPCPAGFCVPTDNLYNYIGGQAATWDNTNKGRTLTFVSPNVFFPVAGQRQNTSGLYGVGGLGYYWSASPKSSSLVHALGLWSWSPGIGWQYYDRAYGFCVRPVAEE